MKIVWSPLALERAIEQAEFIALDKPEAARRWLEGLFEASARLERFPKLGRVVPELRDSAIREIDFEGRRVVDRLAPEAIEILTVRHSRRRFDPGEVHSAPSP